MFEPETIANNSVGCIPEDDDEQFFIHLQFTGLKDRSGAEIYEGDIVADGERNRLVKWSNQNAAFYLGHTDSGKSFYKEFIECGQSQSDGPVHCDNLEIIGNIHQNPELITG